MIKTANSTTPQVQQLADTSNHAAVPPVKMERRGSETSESSLEHLDLGRTPKKLSTLSSATSTPHISNCTTSDNSHIAVLANPVVAAAITEHASRTAIETGAKPARHSQHHDSDEANDYDDDDSADEKRRSSARSHRHYHHKRRSSGRLDKHSVQLEINAENPNSLRKKFRFNRSVADINSLTTNESGFVDASTSSSSQLLNASAASAAHAQQPQHSPETCATGSQSSSSASSSPHGAGASASSPESGIGERDDMKFVCPICEVVSATPHEFTNHIRCHNYTSGDTENFTCRICSKVLSSASSLDRHVLVHTGERPFNCKYCHLTFTTNGNMHRHMRTHKQHQHNHHHRRNSNGTAAAVKHANSNTGNTAAGTPQTTPAISSTQLTNGSNVEGVKASSTKTTAPNTTASVNGTNANGSLLNGGGVVESYDSDGGCSTDSSSAISHNSKNHNNNNNNSIKTSNYNNNVNNFKRKNIDNLDADITLLKRRLKTTINNNVISDEKQMESTPGATDDLQLPATHLRHHQPHLFACPVCIASDFESMLMLSAHMDSEHCDIPAKCRHCDVIFHTHRQLNVHPCTSRQYQTPPRSKDHPTYAEFSSEKSPSLVDRSLHTSEASQMFECPKCSCAFPCASDLDLHVRECRRHSLNRIIQYTEPEFEDDHPQRAFKKRVPSESSVGLDDAEAEEEDDDEEQQQQQHNREEFFRRLYLKHKAHIHAQSMLSPQHSVDDNMDDIKFEADCEKLAQQSHDSKDLADIQSILNMTSSSSTSNFLKNFEHTVNTPSSNYGMDKDEEEAQDAFTSEFRKMKLRGEFPCKLCTAVFPNLRALKGHNRIHLSAAGPSGPFRCNMCPYSICDKAALVRHMRSHNGDRPYECAVCNYAFTTKANCERHLRNRHAKTSRDEVKRAIIYHPSEDSSCDDPTKKLHMFSSPEIDDDVDLQYQHHQPKDRSTPVSHLKEILTCEDGRSSKAMKIQVKSIEQLLDKTTASSGYNEVFKEEERATKATQHPTESNHSPIDLSMDVLDLSKKPAKPSVPKEQPSTLPTPTTAPEAIKPVTSAPTTDDPKFDITVLEKNQQYLLAQQQLINEALPKIVDPTHYFQQLYRNLVFPPINPISPFFLHNSFLPNNLSDLQKYAPLMSRMFGPSPNAPMTADAMKTHPPNANSIAASALMPQASPLLSDKSSISSMNSSPISTNSMHPKIPVTPTSSQAISIPRHPNMQSTTLAGGPVKMVIKNGVLMPKQKQRRYRTERPFACDHCSARFTLRSNMERHVKQQHPQFYAQRQRSGHHIMRGRGASNAAAMNSITHLQAAIAAHNGSGAHVGPASISEQVKYAILAQQLKARKDTDLLHQALAHGSSSVAPSHLTLGPAGGLAQAPKDLHLNMNHLNNSSVNGSLEEEDDPKLIIDEDDDAEELLDDNDEEQYQEDEEDLNESLNELDLVNDSPQMQAETNEPPNKSAKKVAETILEQAIKAGGSSNYNSNLKSNINASPQPAKTMKTMIAQAESVGKFLKEVASSAFKDESQDLVPVAKLVDNATTNAMSFNNYFRPSDVANHMEQSDEEGLVASGSASESNNSGTEDISSSTEPKKKSAYSLAPNRVSCPYCQRMFPWSSSLRRHILTHTGQKPFKCSHCPLLFTTKSNCDRHLLRKHGNVESAVSVYVPTEDVSEPIPVPKSVEEIEQQQRQREEERKRKSEEAARIEKERKEKEQREQDEQEQKELLKQLAAAQTSCAANNLKADSANAAAYSELPFKCHLCDSSFGERFQCLDHIKIQHAQEFSLLLAKGAIDTDPEHNQVHSTEDEECRRPGEDSNGRSGKYPDYSNRKVICAFCVRRFWSTEDLRRHMRTHSGERPFQCDICLRKFTLKHSMLRHMKKHNGRHHSAGAGELSNATNSGSDLSDDEQMSPTAPTNAIVMANTLAMRTHKIQELLSKANEWRTNRMSLGEHKENIAEEHNTQTDLIGNLLGISDQGILNKLLSSPDEAAKLLGVEK